MARPLKQGLDYFPLDCQLDIKFELIEAEYGLTGFGVIVKLFQQIYGQNGYYIEWTDEVALLFAKKIGVGGGVVSEIVGASIRRGIFNKAIFDKYHILTSVGIQKRYLEAVSRRKNFKIKEEYLLIKCAQNKKDVDNNGINVDNNPINDNNNTQSKGKESKGEYIKGEEKKPKQRTSLTKKEREQLINEFGAIAEDYIERSKQYANCHNYATIKQWLEGDKKGKSQNRPKNQFDQFMQREVSQEELDELEKQMLQASFEKWGK